MNLTAMWLYLWPLNNLKELFSGEKKDFLTRQAVKINRSQLKNSVKFHI